MAKILLVLLHGFNLGPASLDPVRNAITTELQDQGHEVVPLCPALPLNLWSLASPVGAALQVVEEIEAGIAGAPADAPIERIIMVGHSMGALLARKAYVIACGETLRTGGTMSRAPFEPEITETDARPWARLVDRIVLVAGLNRGWRVTHHLGLGKAIGWTLGLFLAALVHLISRRWLLVTRVRAGTEFISNLRIQWLRMRRRFVQEHDPEKPGSPPGGATVVQLLGSIDDFISPRDNVDLVTGSDFIYLDVPYSGHREIIDLADRTTPPGGGRSKGDLRRDMIVLAATASEAEVRAHDVRPHDANEGAVQNLEVKKVIFVIHGIRDGGYWTHKVARAVLARTKAKGDNVKLVATETSSYGYFPMLSFLFSFKRREKSEWLMDQYAEALACYPNAQEMHFVGHSNGTYCLADALRRYPCCHFDNVVFAGSVLPTDFPWKHMIHDHDERSGYERRYGSIGRLLNIAATRDWVVAGFPNLFEDIPVQALGGAGTFGFRTSAPQVTQFYYAKGGHGAGIEEPLWGLISEFALTGQAPKEPAAKFADKPNRLVWALGLFPIAAWIAAALIILLLGKLVHLAGSSLACRLGEASEQCRASLPGLGATLHPSNWFTLPAEAGGWLVPILVTLYVLLVIKLLRWV